MTFFHKFLILEFLLFTGFLYSSDPVLFSDDLLKQQNLVDVQSLDSTIGVELMYATTNNFLGKNVYGGLRKSYLRKEAADMLTNAQRILRQKRPGYSLLVYDSLRPRRIQTQMWEIVKGTDKQQYVADPKGGSIHNYGAAVDLTIADENGKPLDMGTPFDYFGVKAQPRYEEYFLQPESLKKAGLSPKIRGQIEQDIRLSGPLSSQEISNRLLLRKVMMQAGFEPLVNEWWHFNAYPNEVVRKKYSIIE